MPGTLPLEWSWLQRQARRRWYADWRGELPARPGTAPISAPLAIAACAWFSRPRSFASQAEAETCRAVAPRALDAVAGWHDAAGAREEVRLALLNLRHWRSIGEARQADLSRTELARRWQRYRRAMRRLDRQIDTVRSALQPRPTRPAPALPACLPPRGVTQGDRLWRSCPFPRRGKVPEGRKGDAQSNVLRPGNVDVVAASPIRRSAPPSPSRGR